MADVAPPELGKLLRNAFYKHYAPLALQNLGIRQQYQAGRAYGLSKFASSPKAQNLTEGTLPHNHTRRRLLLTCAACF